MSEDIEGRQVAWVRDSSSSCRLGERMESTAIRTMKSSRSKYKHYGHDFVFPPPSGVRLCVPQKNGNRNWGTLLHRLWFGTVPETIDQLLTRMSKFDASLRPESAIRTKNILVLFILKINERTYVLWPSSISSIKYSF